MKQKNMYLSWHTVNQTAVGFWPLAVSTTAYSHPNIALSSFQLQAHTQHSQLTPAVQPEASSQKLEAAAQQATSNQQQDRLFSRSSKLEARSFFFGCSTHHSSFIIHNF